MKLYEILPVFEARSRPELNPQISAVEQLRKYKDDPNVFISFTHINKLGINPNGLNGGTPVAIYAFPLQKCWDLYKVEQTNNLTGFPNFNDRKYIQVFKWNGSGKFVNISEYTKSDCAHDLKVLRKMVPDKIDIIERFEKYLLKDSAPFFTDIYLALKNIVRDNRVYDLRQWNHLFRKLGYIGFNDDFGYVIHESEQYQAMFFSAQNIKLLDTILNVDYADKPELVDIDPSKMEVHKMVSLAWKYGKRIQKFEPYIIASGEVFRIQYYMENARMTQRWPQAEPLIYTDGGISTWYAINIVKHRIPQAEPVIMKSSSAKEYKDHFGIK